MNGIPQWTSSPPLLSAALRGVQCDWRPHPGCCFSAQGKNVVQIRVEPLDFWEKTSPAGENNFCKWIGKAARDESVPFSLPQTLNRWVRTEREPREMLTQFLDSFHKYLQRFYVRHWGYRNANPSESLIVNYHAMVDCVCVCVSILLAVHTSSEFERRGYSYQVIVMQRCRKIKSHRSFNK